MACEYDRFLRISRSRHFQSYIYIAITLLMVNLNAIIDLFFHPEISYFDGEHLLVGGTIGLVCIILFVMMNTYETKLRKSEWLNRNLVEHLPHRVFVKDCNSVYVTCNANYARDLGITPEQIVGKDDFDFHPVGLAEAYRDDDRATIETGRVKEIEERYHIAGQVRWIRTLKVPYRDDQGNITGVLGAFEDITERKQGEVTLASLNRQNELILSSTAEGILGLDLQGNHTFINSAAARMLGYKAEELIGRPGHSTWHHSKSDGSPHPKEECVICSSYQDGMVRSASDEVFWRKDGIGFPVMYLTTPIYEQGQQVGTVVTFMDITERKSAEDRLRKAVSTTIQVMVSAVESRDPYTAGHQLRSANMARAIATEMGLTPKKIDGIRVAASIHDIGKLSIPAEILSKPTKLSELEFSLIKDHARQGYEILKDVESQWPLAEIVYQHHERMDGSGYPRHLKGEKILMEARILTVADVVEAMASHRPYRPGLGVDAALEEIEKNKGILYDETVVDACIRLFREKGLQLKEA